MRITEDKLERRIKEQKLICAINEALLEHYQKEKEKGPSRPKQRTPQRPGGNDNP